MQTRPTLLLRTLMAGLLLSWAASAFAQVGIGVAPPRFTFTATPGQALTETVSVFAAKALKTIITPAVVAWTLSPNGVLVTLPLGALSYDASSWVTVADNPFGLIAGKAVEVRFSIRVPKDVGHGTYWTALSFTTKTQPGLHKGVAVAVRTQILAVVYINIAGTLDPAAKISGFFVEKGKNGVRTLVADVQNTGNAVLRLKGKMVFISVGGKSVETLALPVRVLLRNNLVRYQVPMPMNLPKDTVLASLELSGAGPNPLYAEVLLE